MPKAKVKRLTPTLLKKMVLQEKRRIMEVLETGEEDSEKVASKTEEVDAEDQANTLAKDIDYVKALKIKEARLKKALRKVNATKFKIKEARLRKALQEVNKAKSKLKKRIVRAL
jgi:hypothetical protein